MNAAVAGQQLRLLLVVLQILSRFQLIKGACWSSIVRNGRCIEMLSQNSTKEDCCGNNNGLTIAWSENQLDSGTLFFLTMLSGGVPCSPCRDSCEGYDCGMDKKCVLKQGRPRCVCSPNCKQNRLKVKGTVCGTDGRSYRNLCRLKKRACRRRSNNLTIAYYGPCQSSCDKIKCPSGRHCLLDQNLSPHCVKCSKKCSTTIEKRHVCGADGVTYQSTCHLREKACRKGKAIPIAYKGPCKRTTNCSEVRCKDRQTCLTDLDSGGPRCVTCALTCKPRHMHGPICGTNNSTYQSWCHMIQDACNKGFIIETKHSGKCVWRSSPP